MTVHIRRALPADHDAALALIPRLRAFGDVPLRTHEHLDGAEYKTMQRALQSTSADSVVLVADGGDSGIVGIAHAHADTDYFSAEVHGHLSILAVAETAEGQGVGRALLGSVEAWSKERGYRFLTLNVFANNTRARAVYERSGFAADTFRYYKTLGE